MLASATCGGSSGGSTGCTGAGPGCCSICAPDLSSDQHPWFTESRSSRTGPKRDWYIWRDSAPGGGPTHNGTSDFGGSSWDQYYLQAALKEQPDLLAHPRSARDDDDALRFWLGRGVEGGRPARQSDLERHGG